MDRSSGPPLASPLLPPKPGTPRLRRKLQKVARQRNQQQRQHQPPGRLASGPASIDSLGRRTSKLGTHQAQAKPSLPLPPDLSDSKWLEYIRRSGYLCALDHPSAQPRSSPSISAAAIIPELSHLGLSDDVDDASPRGSHARLAAAAAAAGEAEAPHYYTTATASPSSSSSTITIMRRRAKTPVFSIGQLERPRPREYATISKVSSVELIAEQYRALLESRNSMFTDSHSEPPLSPSRHDGGGDEDDVVEELAFRRDSVDDCRRGVDLVPVAVPSVSPTSDDGTLVAFEEETVYFKPVSFSPEPRLPAPHRHEFPGLASPAPTPDNLSLQICLDLLTRELMSAVTDQPQKTEGETSALKILVMIEAYERLRDQLQEARLGPDELRPLQIMFDTWLRALYTIHDSLTGDAEASETECEALGTADLG